MLPFPKRSSRLPVPEEHSKTSSRVWRREPLQDPAGSIRQVAISPQKLTALGASEEALELLERYSRAVSDPQVTLKGLSPMVDELESMKARLDGAASFISDDDPLKGIMSEVSSALYGEVLRFRRGDLIG